MHLPDYPLVHVYYYVGDIGAWDPSHGTKWSQFHLVSQRQSRTHQWSCHLVIQTMLFPLHSSENTYASPTTNAAAASSAFLKVSSSPLPTSPDEPVDVIWSVSPFIPGQEQGQRKETPPVRFSSFPTPPQNVPKAARAVVCSRCCLCVSKETDTMLNPAPSLARTTETDEPRKRSK